MQNFLGGCVRERAGWEGGSEWDTEGTTNLERISDVYNLKKKLHVLQTVFSLPFVFGFSIGTQNGGWCKFWIFSYLDAGEPQSLRDGSVTLSRLKDVMTLFLICSSVSLDRGMICYFLRSFSSLHFVRKILCKELLVSMGLEVISAGNG